MEKTIKLSEKFTIELMIRTRNQDAVKEMLDENRFTFLFVETPMRSVTTAKITGLTFARADLLRKLLKQLIYD